MTNLLRYVRGLLWRQTLVWTSLLALVAYGNAQAYKAAYPTRAERRRVAAQISRNPGFQALYGRAHHLDTLGGFAAVGAFTSQLAIERRRAASLAAIVLGASFLLRVAADASPPLSWLRWATPFGWLEEVRPFSGSRLGPLVLIVAIIALLAGSAVTVAGRRDLGSAVGPWADDSASKSRFYLLSGPLALAFRERWGSVATWAASLGAFAFVIGLLAKDVSSFASTGPGFQKFASRLGAAELNRPVGFVGLFFGLLVLALVLHVAAGLATAREEEGSGRLELILARAVSRRSWLSACLLTIVVGAAIVILLTAACIWLGGELRGVPVGVGQLMVGALNCLPVAVLFGGTGSLALAFVPRLTAPLAYGAVTVAYLLQLIGGLTSAPGWVLDLSPFHHVAASPAVPVNWGAAIAMTVIGVATAIVSTEAFARRDLAGA